jgi:quinol-cytochrome oxidoreductase complex cytochrome b subunit
MEKKSEAFYPKHYYRALIIAFLLLGVLMTLGVYFPHGLSEKADPFQMPDETFYPPWYFLPVFKLVELMPEKVGETIQFLLLILFFIWPFVDRGPGRHYSQRKISAFIGLLVLIGFVGLLIWGWLS